MNQKARAPNLKMTVTSPVILRRLSTYDRLSLLLLARTDRFLNNWHGISRLFSSCEFVLLFRQLEEEWTRRPRKKLLAAHSIAVKHYAEKLLDKTKDEMKRLDIFADDAPPLDSSISIQVGVRE